MEIAILFGGGAMFKGNRLIVQKNISGYTVYVRNIPETGGEFEILSSLTFLSFVREKKDFVTFLQYFPYEVFYCISCVSTIIVVISS